MTHSSAHSSSLSALVRPAATGGFAVGLGLTNECNLACSFCYRDPARLDRLSLEQVRSAMASLPVRSVNLGTGENGMHPEFHEILAYLRSQPVKLTITSNGHSVAVLTDDELRAFHDIEFSLDYATEEKQDAQRGAGNWALIHQQAARCVRLGVPVTVIAVMMKANYLGLANVARVAKRFGAPLRVNVYQAVRSDLYALTYDEYWQGFRALFAETDVIAISEPLVRAMAGLPARVGGCGASTVRVTPRATTQPCVYWAGAGEPLSLLLSSSRKSWTLRRSSRRAPHPKHAARVHSSRRAAVAAPDAAVCKTRCTNRTFIALSSGAKPKSWKFAWLRPANCPKAKARAPPS